VHLGCSCQGGRKQRFVVQSASPSQAGPLPHEPLLLNATIPIKQHRHDQLATNLNSKAILKQRNLAQLISKPICAGPYLTTYWQKLMGRIREMLRLISQMEQGETCLSGFNRWIPAQILGNRPVLPAAALDLQAADEPMGRSTQRRPAALGERRVSGEEVGEEEDKVLELLPYKETIGLIFSQIFHCFLHRRILQITLFQNFEFCFDQKCWNRL
jgi:hypothetical protein